MNLPTDVVDRLINVRLDYDGEVLVELAKAISEEAYAGKRDYKGNDLFMRHVMPVVSRISDDSALAVAYLHRIVEDTEVTLWDLLKLGIRPTTIFSVEMLGIVDSINDKVFAKHRIKTNDAARMVRLVILQLRMDSIANDIEQNDLMGLMSSESLTDAYALAKEELDYLTSP